ncbi:hypothetical protein DFH06DRAFT_1144939 [Mycena polygramma]|nr:hypothetical protein DFH06DRAFT_1144939 [Mycena polygramma]
MWYTAEQCSEYIQSPQTVRRVTVANSGLATLNFGGYQEDIARLVIEDHKLDSAFWACKEESRATADVYPNLADDTAPSADFYGAHKVWCTKHPESPTRFQLNFNLYHYHFHAGPAPEFVVAAKAPTGFYVFKVLLVRYLEQRSIGSCGTLERCTWASPPVSRIEGTYTDRRLRLAAVLYGGFVRHEISTASQWFMEANTNQHGSHITQRSRKYVGSEEALLNIQHFIVYVGEKMTVFRRMHPPQDCGCSNKVELGLFLYSLGAGGLLTIILHMHRLSKCRANAVAETPRRHDQRTKAALGSKIDPYHLKRELRVPVYALDVDKKQKGGTPPTPPLTSGVLTVGIYHSCDQDWNTARRHVFLEPSNLTKEEASARRMGPLRPRLLIQRRGPKRPFTACWRSLLRWTSTLIQRGFDDPRFIVIARGYVFLDDWKRGVYGQGDYWTLADEFIAKRNAGQIDMLGGTTPV